MLMTDTARDDQGAQNALPALCVPSLDCIRRAIRDPELDRGHLKVLAHLTERFNASTLTAWPSRERIAEAEGLDPKTVGNKLYDLKRHGYVDWGRSADPKRPRRSLLHYWLQEEAIAEAVKALRKKSAIEPALPGGREKCPSGPGRAIAGIARPAGLETALPAGLQSARRAGCKELDKEGTQREGARTHRAHATRIPSPHMNGIGYVVSEEHGLIIPVEKVAEWREKFNELSDLEAAMSKLGTIVLNRGRTHPGWTSLEGWMVAPLSEMNAEAADRRRMADAKIARVQGSQPTKTFRR